MQAYGPGFDASWRPPRVHLDAHLTDDDVTWLNGQMEAVDAPSVRFARELPIPPLPSGIIPHAASSLAPGELAKLRDRFLAQQGQPPRWI
jgi:hypothetical protein